MARRRRKKLTAGQMFTLLLVAAVLLVAAHYLIMNYFFVVRSVSVQMPENSRFTAQQVASASGLKLGTRMDRVSEEELSRALQGTGWLILDDVELNYPNRVHLVVAERRPAALVSHVSTLLVTDADGVMIEQVTGDPGYPDCVYITDLDVRRAQPGQVLQAGTSGRVEAMIVLLQGFEAVPCQDLISWASLEDTRNIRMYSTNHVWVEMGDQQRMSDKLRWTEAALTDMISRNESLGTLNVSTGNFADYAPEK